MYEYVFFHKKLAEELLKEARKHDPNATIVHEEPAWEVHVAETISDATEARLSALYDTLFEQDRDQYESEHAHDPANGYHAASVELVLNNGQRVYAQTDPVIMDKITNALSHQELLQFLADIVFAVENPDERSICQRYRDQQ